MSRAGRVLICGVATVALSALVAGPAIAEPSGSGPGNSRNARACQNGGWEDLMPEDGTAFANQGDCVSYAARGGELQPKSVAQQICEDAGGTFRTCHRWEPI